MSRNRPRPHKNNREVLKALQKAQKPVPPKRPQVLSERDNPVLRIELINWDEHDFNSSELQRIEQSQPDKPALPELTHLGDNTPAPPWLTNIPLVMKLKKLVPESEIPLCENLEITDEQLLAIILLWIKVEKGLGNLLERLVDDSQSTQLKSSLISNSRSRKSKRDKSPVDWPARIMMAIGLVLAAPPAFTSVQAILQPQQAAAQQVVTAESKPALPPKEPLPIDPVPVEPEVPPAPTVHPVIIIQTREEFIALIKLWIKEKPSFKKELREMLAEVNTQS